MTRHCVIELARIKCWVKTACLKDLKQRATVEIEHPTLSNESYTLIMQELDERMIDGEFIAFCTMLEEVAEQQRLQSIERTRKFVLEQHENQKRVMADTEEQIKKFWRK